MHKNSKNKIKTAKNKLKKAKCVAKAQKTCIIRIVRKLSQMIKVLYEEEMICITEDIQEKLN